MKLKSCDFKHEDFYEVFFYSDIDHMQGIMRKLLINGEYIEVCEVFEYLNMLSNYNGILHILRKCYTKGQTWPK